MNLIKFLLFSGHLRYMPDMELLVINLSYRRISILGKVSKYDEFSNKHSYDRRGDVASYVF